MKILGLFHPERTSLTLKEIAKETGINTTSTFRFVETFVQLGYLKKDPKSKRIELGPNAIALGNRMIRSSNLLQNFTPILNRTYSALNLSIDCAVLDGQTLVMVYERDAKGSFTFNSPTVQTALHCTSLGKAVLAALPEEKTVEVVKRLYLTAKTDRSITDRNLLLEDLQETRKRGYALNDQEYISGLIAVGAPILNLETRLPIGAVSFNFFTLKHSLKEVEKEYSGVVTKLAKELSEQIPAIWGSAPFEID